MEIGAKTLRLDNVFKQPTCQSIDVGAEIEWHVECATSGWLVFIDIFRKHIISLFC